jgi:magnesium-transporting ATPase (P-type)
MFIVFFGAVILKDSPLNAVQMLWVNLIMDTFAALALATEPPEDDILTRQPYLKDAPIMTAPMWRNVFGHAIYQIIVLITMVFACQGTLVSVYDSTKSTIDPKFRNPFFAQNLYYGAVFDNGFMDVGTQNTTESLLAKFSF